MKKLLIYIAMAGATLLTSSCNDWLDVLPKNEQVSPEYWKTKEQVEEVLAQGYQNMRLTVPTLIYWGELRGASIYAYSGKSKQELQNFQLNSSSGECKWGGFYSILNVANSIIKYAPEVKRQDETYHEAVMNSNMAEAYFMRAWTYFTLVRNFKEVPLILEPYMTDEYAVDIPKSSEETIIAQIKLDIENALSTGAAKEMYDDEDWTGMSKGRVTVWALYALMADVCLWSEDYDGCVRYADMLINSTSAFRPAFVEDPEQWYNIFFPGNSNGSIFELNFDQSRSQSPDDDATASTYPSPSNVYPWTQSTVASLQFSNAMCKRLFDEQTDQWVTSNTVRGYGNTFVLSSGTVIGNSNTEGYLPFKFRIGGKDGLSTTRSYKDANWILYRMADVLLMKAEALIWKGGEANFAQALELINKIRTRANVTTLSVQTNAVSQENMLGYLLQERDLEFAAEGKRWYDLLRFGRSQNFKYKDQFINMIIENNSTVSASWIRSVLKNTDAWYLPISQGEIDSNPNLIQNPYYDVTAN